MSTTIDGTDVREITTDGEPIVQATEDGDQVYRATSTGDHLWIADSVSNSDGRVIDTEVNTSFDISTKSSTTAHRFGGSLPDLSQSPGGIHWHPTGKKFYVLARNVFIELDLDNVWDLSSYTKSTYTLNQGYFSFTMNNDGTKAYARDSDDIVQSWTLSTRFDMSTRSTENSVSFENGDTQTSDGGISFDDDGDQINVGNGYHHKIKRFTLSTKFDISTATFDTEWNVPDNDRIGGHTFNDDGTRLYVSVQSVDDILSYDLSTPWDVTSAGSLKNSISSGADPPYDIDWASPS